MACKEVAELNLQGNSSAFDEAVVSLNALD
jgi:hypothetical protein